MICLFNKKNIKTISNTSSNYCLLTFLEYSLKLSLTSWVSCDVFAGLFNDDAHTAKNSSNMKQCVCIFWTPRFQSSYLLYESLSWWDSLSKKRNRRRSRKTELSLCLLIRGKEVIGLMPEWEAVTIPKAWKFQEPYKIWMIATPYPALFQHLPGVRNPSKPSTTAIFGNGKLESLKSNLDVLNESATFLAQKVQGRLPDFLRTRCPIHLQPQ